MEWSSRRTVSFNFDEPAAIGLNHVTTQRYAGVFEQLFLTRSLGPWHSNGSAQPTSARP
jgi:predicted AAA+ superfamily ATPase